MKKKAFSLIELSIVLIIIGLLVAGVSSGGKLISQTKIRGLISDIYNFEQAIITFRLTYDAEPGDFDNAHSYWGNDCASVANDCNGDGDGFIHYNTSSYSANESLRAWQHLQLAEIINEGLTGLLYQIPSL